MQTFNFVLSQIYCPFPTTLNPMALELEQHTARWVQDFNLLSNDKCSQTHFDSSKFSRLVARACPTATFEGLTVAADLMAFLFLLDDYCDQAAIGKQPENLKTVFGSLLEIMRTPFAATSGRLPRNTVDNFKATLGANLPAVLTPFVTALLNIWQRLNQLPGITPDWLQRFTKNLQDSVEANLWEASNRANQLIPDLATYISKRALTNGFYWCQDLSELVEQIDLPADIRECSSVRQLAQTTTNVTGWFNDIISLEKELNFSDFHNLVLILQHHYQLVDLEAAVKQAVKLHNHQVQLFIELERQLPSFGTNQDYQLKRYVEAMRIWMRSNVDWSLESGRYSNLAGLVGYAPSDATLGVESPAV